MTEEQHVEIIKGLTRIETDIGNVKHDVKGLEMKLDGFVPRREIELLAAESKSDRSLIHKRIDDVAADIAAKSSRWFGPITSLGGSIVIGIAAYVCHKFGIY